MDPLEVANTSPALNRHITAVAGLCNVTVGYNSSSAGTNKGKVKEGGTGPSVDCGWCGSPGIGGGINPAAEPIGRVETGGLTMHSFTLKVTAAVTMTPSQVSKAEPSSKQTRHPTVARSPYELSVGSTGLHHWPAVRICPVVQRPTDPFQAPTRVFGGISLVESPMDSVAILAWGIKLLPGLGITVISK